MFSPETIEKAKYYGFDLDFGSHRHATGEKCPCVFGIKRGLLGLGPSPFTGNGKFNAFIAHPDYWIGNYWLAVTPCGRLLINDNGGPFLVKHIFEGIWPTSLVIHQVGELPPRWTNINIPFGGSEFLENCKVVLKRKYYVPVYDMKSVEAGVARTKEIIANFATELSLDHEEKADLHQMYYLKGIATAKKTINQCIEDFISSYHEKSRKDIGRNSALAAQLNLDLKRELNDND